MAPPPSRRRPPATSSPRRNTSPRPRRWYWSASTISSSTKSRIRGRFSTSVTLTPSVAAIEAYSRPITPPPTTVSVRGSSARGGCRRSRARCGRRSRRPPGRAGAVPTAMTMPLGVHRGGCAPPPATSSVCGSTNDAVPERTRDAVAPQLVGDHLVLVLDHLARAPEQVVDRDLVLDAVGAAVDAARRPVSSTIAARSVFDGRVPVFVETPPSDRLALDDRGALAELGRLDGGALAGGAGADRDQVVVGVAEVIGGSSFRRRPRRRSSSGRAESSRMAAASMVRTRSSREAELAGHALEGPGVVAVDAVAQLEDATGALAERLHGVREPGALLGVGDAGGRVGGELVGDQVAEVVSSSAPTGSESDAGRRSAGAGPRRGPRRRRPRGPARRPRAGGRGAG